MSRILFFIASVVICGGLLLWVGGDLSFRNTAPSALPVEQLTGDFERGEGEAQLILQQKLAGWTFKGFNRDVGQYDFFASGSEIVPVKQRTQSGTESYLAKDLKINVLSFRRDSGQVKRSSVTEIVAAEGTIALDRNRQLVGAILPGASAMELRPEEGAGTQPIYIQTSGVTVTPLQQAKDKETGTKLKITAKGKSRIKIGGSDIYGAGFTADTLQKRLVLSPPAEMYVSPQQIESLFPKLPQKGAKQVFKVTADGEVSMTEKALPSAPALREILVQRNVVLTDGVSHLFCENLSLVTGSDQKVSELRADQRVRLERVGVTCVAQTLVYKAVEKMVFLTGAPDITITSEANEIFCNSAQISEDSSYAEAKGNVKFRHKTAPLTKRDAKTPEETVTLFCESAQVWFTKDEQSGKMQITRLVAHGTPDKQASAESEQYLITGSEFECGFAQSRFSVIDVKGTDGKFAEFKRPDGQRVSSRTIRFDPQSSSALFTDDVNAFLITGQGQDKSSLNFSADKLNVQFERDSQTGEMTPATISAESKTRVQAKCLFKEKEFQFEGSSLDYSKERGTVSLGPGQKKGEIQTVAEGENRLSAPSISFHLSDSSLILHPGVEGKLLLPPPKEAKQTAEKPLFAGEWTISCNTLELFFAEKEKELTRLQAKNSVKLQKQDANCEIICDALSYDRAASRVILTGAAENPVLKQQKNYVKAKKITLQIDTNLASFEENAESVFSSDAPQKPSLALTSKMIAAKFARGTQGIQEVYARNDVRAKITQPDGAVTRITAEEAVYQAPENTISVRGSPCILTQPHVSIKESEIVYDLEKKVITTKPGEKGYKWEIDPSNWRQKTQNKKE